MKVSCKVIQDLLPLYAEKMTSHESNLLIEEHMDDCSKCADMLNSIKVNMAKNKPDTEGGASLKFVQKNIKKRKAKAIVFASLIVFLAMFTVFSYLTRPSYISYKDSEITISESSQQVYANFSDKVTSYRVAKHKTQENLTIMEIEAWTSIWDKLLDKSSPSVLISTSGSKVDTVYYCDYSTEVDNMNVVYGINPDTDGGRLSLPRLFLGYYFVMACIVAVIIGAVWLLFRKNHKVSNIFMYLFFVPISYLIGHLIITTKFIAFSATRDFLMNVIAAIAIYGISILGISLFKQNRKDRCRS